MKKIIVVLAIGILTIGVKAQGIIGMGYTKGDANGCSHLSACASSGYRIRGINKSIADEKIALKADLFKLSDRCAEVEFKEFIKGDVVAIYLITVEDKGCKWSKFILGKGKSEEEAIKDAEEKIIASPEKTKNNLGRLETISF